MSTSIIHSCVAGVLLLLRRFLLRAPCPPTSRARPCPHPRAQSTREPTCSRAMARISLRRSVDTSSPLKTGPFQRCARFRFPWQLTGSATPPSAAAGGVWGGGQLRDDGGDELRDGGHQPHPGLRRPPVRRRPRHLRGEGAARARTGGRRAPNHEAESAAGLVRTPLPSYRRHARRPPTLAADPDVRALPLQNPAATCQATPVSSRSRSPTLSAQTGEASTRG